MADITIGLEFGVNETPTKAKFEAQAKSINVTGLDVSNFQSGVVLIKSDPDSGSSGALEASDLPGQLWIDIRGDVWVQDQAGPVKLYRYDMGWESRRYFIQPRSGSGLDETPFRAITATLNSRHEDFGRGIGDTDSTGVILEMNETAMGTTQNGRYNGVVQDTGSSGFVRWSGRGGTVLHEIDQNTSTWSYDRDFKNNVRLWTLAGAGPISYLKQYNSVDFPANQDKYNGYGMAPTAGTSAVSDGNFATNGYLNKVQCYAWNYGLYMRGERTRGPLNP